MKSTLSNASMDLFMNNMSEVILEENGHYVKFSVSDEDDVETIEELWNSCAEALFGRLQ